MSNHSESSTTSSNKYVKPNYNKRDWKTYEKGLQDRGSLTLWFTPEAIATWHPSKTKLSKRGGQLRYSDLAIETSQTLRIIYNHPLRQTEGFLKSIATLMQLDITIPDHTTISRRTKNLTIKHKSSNLDSTDNTVIMVDSTGVKVIGEKEWMNYKHGTKQRKKWRKLHLCISKSGEILSSILTEHTVSDPSQVSELLEGVKDPVDEFIADGAYDNKGVYNALKDQESTNKKTIKAIIPPNTGFQAKKESDPLERLNNIDQIEKSSRSSWKKKHKYGRRSLVENAMHRYKTIIGNKLRSTNSSNQIVEAKIGVNILNTMLGRGMSSAKK